MSLRGPVPTPTTEARRAEFTDGWMDGWMDGVSKVSFKFLYTLWVYSTCIYLLICILKNCNQDPYGFENFDTLKCFIYGWMDGWMDGWMGYQKCPSIFFILCAYIDHICNLLYM